MILNAQNLPVAKITSTTLRGQNGQASINGFSVGGVWLNGSQDFATAEALHTHLMGKELTPSQSGKSLVIKGEFAPRDTDFLKSVVTKREPINLVALDLNSLI